MKLYTLMLTLALWLALAAPALAKSTAYKAGYAFFFIVLAALIVFGLVGLVRLVRRR